MSGYFRKKRSLLHRISKRSVDPLFDELAATTGGQVLTASKSDIDEAVGIVEDAISVTKVGPAILLIVA